VKKHVVVTAGKPIYDYVSKQGFSNTFYHYLPQERHTPLSILKMFFRNLSFYKSNFLNTPIRDVYFFTNYFDSTTFFFLNRLKSRTIFFADHFKIIRTQVLRETFAQKIVIIALRLLFKTKAYYAGNPAVPTFKMDFY